MNFQTTIGDGSAIVDVVFEIIESEYLEKPYKHFYSDMIQATEVIYKKVNILEALTEDQLLEIEDEIAQYLNDKD